MAQFDYFVILAEMRTGSNLLEAYLNEAEGLRCEGEAFNTAFVAYPKVDVLYGFDRAARDANPLALLGAFRKQDGLAGFRYFHDHDPRVFEPFMRDPRCAKIILTRNPIESYVSLKIARETNQWRLGDVKNKRAAKVVFDPVEFAAHVGELQGFQTRVQTLLQITGQAAFYIGYEDIKKLDVINGLLRWLGVGAQIERAPRKLKRQNPEPLEEKLVNPEAVAEGLARLDRFNLARTPNFEPRPPPTLWGLRACPELPLVYAPIPGGFERAIFGWMAKADGVAMRALLSDFTPESWRNWQRTHPKRLSFTVLRHPLARAHQVFVNQVVLGNRTNVRGFIERVHGVMLPEDEAGAQAWGHEAHRQGFEGFLRFVQANLAGQTALPVRPIWASQTRLIEAMVAQCPPQRMLREARLAEDLPALAGELGHPLPPFKPPERNAVLRLEDIYVPEIEAACRAAYAIDYDMLGFGDWSEE
ncbi:MAG: nodulation protein NodH [Rhodobacteraceae bacterium]|nr:MAG: nodulation protein NodH [Paracoccaceae bacterium]